MKYKTWDRKIDFVVFKAVYYGILFSAFIPLIIFRGFVSPTNFGKGIVFRILVEVIFVLYVYLAIKYSQLRPWNIGREEQERFKFPALGFIKNNLVLLGLFLFVISYAISSFTGVDWRNSMWGSWERMGGLFSMLHYLVFFIILIGVFKSKEDWKNLLNLSIFVAFLTIIYGFVQMFSVKFVIASDRSRMLGTIGNTSMFAGYLLFNFYFALFFLVEKLKSYPVSIRKFFYKDAGVMFYSVFVVISLAALFLIQSRGTLLGLGLTLSWLVFVAALKFYRRKNLRFLYRYGLIVLLLIVFLSGILIYLNRDSAIVQKIPKIERLLRVSLTNSDPTTVSRLLVWGEALQTVKEKPFLGWGPENFTTAFLKFYNPKLFIAPTGELYFDRPHNVFLDVASAQGMVGLASYLFLIYAVVLGIRKFKDRSVLFALLAAYLIYDFFFFDMIATYLMLLFFLGFITSGGYQNSGLNFSNGQPFMGQDLDNKKLKKYPRPAYLAMMLALALSTVFLIYKTSVLSVRVNSTSVRALSTLAKGNYGEAINKMKHINDLGIIDNSKSEALFEFLPYYLDNIERFKKVNGEEVVRQDMLFFIKMLEKETARNKSPVLKIYLSNTYKRYAMIFDESYFGKSEAVLTDLIAVYPQMPVFYLELGDVKAWQKDEELSLIYFEKAHNLNKDSFFLKFQLAKRKILYNQDDGFDLAIDAINKGYADIADIIELAKRLHGKNRTQDAINLLSSVERRPVFEIALVRIYIDLGDMEKARQLANVILVDKGKYALKESEYLALAEIFVILDDPDRRFEAQTKAGFGTIYREVVE